MTTEVATTLAAAGYIVHDGNLIHGAGATEELAMADLKRGFDMARIDILDDAVDTSEMSGSWCRASDLHTAPATAALLAKVKAEGGALAWGAVGGVACTRDEEES